MPCNHLILCCPLSSCIQSFPVSGSFPVSWLFSSGSQSIGVSALVSVLPMNIQGWFPLGLTGLISLLSKGLSRLFSNNTVQKCQFLYFIIVDLSMPVFMETDVFHSLLLQSSYNNLLYLLLLRVFYLLFLYVFCFYFYVSTFFGHKLRHKIMWMYELSIFK